MNEATKLENAFRAFDAYNSNDPHAEIVNGKKITKELLYAWRMTERLELYEHNAPEEVRLAVRCQHIGRWEIPRKAFPMDRIGYLKWRSKLAVHHAAIAEEILQRCGYGSETIEKVKSLLQKKGLVQGNPETQLLEDVICLVFIEHYLEDFTLQHEDEKVIDILKKTIRKMSSKALSEVSKIKLSERIRQLIGQALA